MIIRLHLLITVIIKKSLFQYGHTLVQHRYNQIFVNMYFVFLDDFESKQCFILQFPEMFFIVTH